MIEGPALGQDRLEAPSLLEAPNAHPPRKRRSRLDYYLRLSVGAGLIFLGWSIATGWTPGSPAPSYDEFVEIPVRTPAGTNGAMPLDNAEEFASTYAARRDSEGSYVASAQELLGAFGAELQWADYSDPNRATGCARGDGDPDIVFAWYCGAEPYVIYLNRNSSSVPGFLYQPEFIDAVKHELAHLVIDRRWCNPLHFPDDTEIEGITSSYANLYLGADREVLSDLNSGFPEYTMTRDTDTAARVIHGDTCP